MFIRAESPRIHNDYYYLECDERLGTSPKDQLIELVTELRLWCGPGLQPPSILFVERNKTKCLQSFSVLPRTNKDLSKSVIS